MMERYIVREPRIPDPQNNQSANQLIAITGGNNESRDNGIYMERHVRQNQNYPHTVPFFMQFTPTANKQDYGNVHINSPSFMNNCLPGQGQVMSGIDPRYLASYADPNTNFIAGQQIQIDRSTIRANTPFGGDYQNHGPPGNMTKTFISKERSQDPMILEPPRPYQNMQNNWQPMNPNRTKEPTMTMKIPKSYQKDMETKWQPMNNMRTQEPTKPIKPYQKDTQGAWQSMNTPPIKKIETSDVQKSEIPNQIMTRADKLKALHKSGARVFSGPVEKILKWHKALQEIGVYVLYEIVAKCVTIRQAEPCAKNLVVRDESGPAMQIVYYEVDFLLPELKPPCTVRIIGRMMTGTSRFQAFNVRLATGDDIAMLPRRAAVAAHHVAKICKENAI